MIKIAWIQIFATLFQLITSTAGACSDTNVGVREELKTIPDGQMAASSNTGDASLGRLHGASAWCPTSGDTTLHLQIDLGQNYLICGVEVQGNPGAVVTTSFTLETSTDDVTYTPYQSSQQFNSATPNDGDAADFHGLDPVIDPAQYIRFKPISDGICLRVEVYGTPVGVIVTCNENDMQVQIDRNQSPHDLLDPATLRLIDSGCTPSFTADFINFDITLGTCGTTVFISSDGLKYLYRNEIIVNPSTKKFDVTCSYIRTCSDTNVGVRDELKTIPDGDMSASSNTGDASLGRLHGASAWCPTSGDTDLYLGINLGQNYLICGVEVQGDPGSGVTTSFTLETSTDDITYTPYQSNQQFDSATLNDGDAADFHGLDPVIDPAQYIRFKPINDGICLRVEAYGTPVGVIVTCNEDLMQVQIDRNQSPHDLLDPLNLRLSDNACTPSFTSADFINFDITLGTCGTTVVISSDGVKSFYRNEIIQDPGSNKKFDVICTYIRSPTAFTPGTGSFSFAMNIFSDAAHTPGNEITGADGPISLGTSLYFKVDVQSSDSNTELHLTSCRATKTSDPNDSDNYIFITNGCETDAGDFISEYNCANTDNFQTFKLSVFRFAGSTSGDSIYFHCDAVVCLISNSGSICNTQCPCLKRKRRTVGEDSKKDLAEAHLVLGPYKIIDNDKGNNGGDDSEDGTEKEEGPTEAIKDSENFPATLVAVVCVSALVAIAIIIGLLVMVRLSKSARGPAVKDITADLARDNLAFEDLEIKTLSIKSNEKPI